MKYARLIAVATMLSVGSAGGRGSGTPATPPAAAEKGTDRVWIGLLGLIGLAGLAGRRRDRTTLNRRGGRN